MPQNQVTVLLTAKDQISGVVRGITGQIAAMAAAFASVAALNEGITSAAKIETGIIAGAGDVATLMGVSYKQALATVKEVQKEISGMAAALPGETAGYGEIAMSVSAAVAQAAKGNLKQYKDDVTEITKVLGFLAASKDVNMTQAASASNKFISGSGSLSELFGSNDVFQKNPLFRTYLQEQLKLIGKQEKDWQSLSQEVRIKVIKLAGKKAVTGDVLNALNDSFDSAVQSIKSNLFDPQIGAFGFLREVATRQNRTGLDAAKGFLASFLKLSETVNDTLESLGINTDPMFYIIGAIDFVSDFTNGLNQFIHLGDSSNLKKLFGGIKIDGKALAEGVNFLVRGFSKVMQNIDWFALGRETFRILFDFFSNIDWVSIGTTILTTIASALDFVLGFLAEQIKTIYSKLEALFKNIIPDFFQGKAANKVADQFTNDRKQVEDFNRNNPTAIPKSTSGVGLPPSQQQHLNPDGSFPSPRHLDLRGYAPMSNTASTFAPVIQISAVANDLRQTADYVMAEIDRQYREYTNSTIALA